MLGPVKTRNPCRPVVVSLDSLVPANHAEVVDDHLVELFGDQGEPVDPVVEEEVPPLLHHAGRTETPAEHPIDERRWDVLQECRLDPDRPLSPGYERLSSRKISRTGQDATPMAVRYGGTALGYQDHYLVDGGKARIILHALVTPGDVMENQPFRDQLRRTMFRYRLRPKRVIADTAYGTVENLLVLEEEGIRAFMPLPEWEKSSPTIAPQHLPMMSSVMSISVQKAKISRCAGRTTWEAEVVPSCSYCL